MNYISEILSLDNACEYVNEKLNLKLDIKSFLVLCLENRIWIKHKALTKYTALKGFPLSAFEAEELKKHYKSQQKSFIDPPNEDNSIYRLGSFESIENTIYHRIYGEMVKKQKEIAKKNFSKERQHYWLHTKASIEDKDRDFLAEFAHFTASKDEIEKLMMLDKEYLDILLKKNEINRLHMIATSYRTFKLNNTTYAFSLNNLCELNEGIYEFVDSDLTGKNRLIDSIKREKIEDYYSYHFIIYDGEFYLKYSDKKDSRWVVRESDNSLQPELGVFQKGFLKSDITQLIHILSQKEKSVKDSKILHSRTANNASKIIGALCELNGLDITQPFGETNKKIMATLDQLDSPIGKDVIGEWLKLAHENIK